MMTMVRKLNSLLRDRKGSVAIETAFVAPALLLMSFGGFEVSSMVARYHELQSGASEAEAVALAANMGAETNVNELERMIRNSLDLNENQVSVVKKFRCNGSNELLDTADTCSEDDDILASYVELKITDNYKPVWTSFGFSKTFHYRVNRMVQLS